MWFANYIIKMRTINYLTLLSVAILFLSCNESRDKQDLFSLEKSDKQLLFTLDDFTKNETQALFPYTDENGTEYLTFQNLFRNEILFYDMNTQSLAFKIKPPIEGHNGVGMLDGYYVKNTDSIFLTTRKVNKIIMIDKECNIKDVFPYYETDDSVELKITTSVSFLYHPVVLFGNKLFIMPECNRFSEKNPVCAAIDLHDRSVQTFPSFSYPSFPGQDSKMKSAGVELYVSRCFNGKQFVYSFYYDENIYVAPINHESVIKTSVKSKYINRVELPNDYGGATFEDMCTKPHYGNLLYDEYREVYYRIAYPRITLEKGDNPLEIMRFGGKNFSLIILDKVFKVLGETLFPDHTYNPTVIFIRKDGLYISESHNNNPDFNDDILSFRRFDLTKVKPK
jgi:hypothetical protein